MIEVSLGALQQQLNATASSLFKRSVPTFLLWLVLLDCGAILIGWPGLARIFAADDGYSLPSLIVILLVNGGLLVGAGLLRASSPMHGSVSALAEQGEPLTAAALFERARLFGLLATGDPRLVKRRRLFSLAFVGLFAIGAYALTRGGFESLDLSTLLTLPVVAVVWIAAAMLLAVVASMTLAFEGDGADKAGLAAAVFLSLLFHVGSDPAGAPSLLVMFLIGCLFAAAVAVFVYTVANDFMRPTVFLLTSTDDYPAGVYRCAPDPTRKTRGYLQFSLNETSPVVAFVLRQGERNFRAISVTDVNQRVPLHDRHVWIWNVAKVSRQIPNEVTIADRNSFISVKLALTRVLSSVAVTEGREVSQAALEAAGQNILVESFPQLAQVALSTVYKAYADTRVDELEALERELKTAPDAISAWSAMARGYGAFDQGGSNHQFEMDAVAERVAQIEAYLGQADRFKQRVGDLEEHYDKALKAIKASSATASGEITQGWLAEISNRLADVDVNGYQLSFDEARYFISLLGLRADVVETTDSERAVALKERFATVRADVLKALEGLEERRDREIAHQHKIEEIIVTGLAQHPVGLQRISKSIESDPSYIKKIARGGASDARPSPSEDDFDDSSPTRRQKPRGRS